MLTTATTTVTATTNTKDIKKKISGNLKRYVELN